MSTSTTPRSRTWPVASNSNGTASDPKRNASDTISKLLSGTSTCLLAQVPQPDDEAAADAFDQEISQCQPNLLDLISVAVTDNTTITSGGSPDQHQDKPEPPKEEEQPVQEEQVEKKKDTWVTFTADFPTEHYLPAPPQAEAEQPQAEQEKGGEDHNNNIEVEIQDHFEELGLPQDKSSSDRQGLLVYLHHKSKRFVSRLSGWSDSTPREYQHQYQEGDDELDTQDNSHHNHNHKSALHARQLCLCILCLVILAAIAVPVVVCNLYDKCGSNNDNDSNKSNQSQEQQDNDSILMTSETTTTTETPSSTTTTTAPPRDDVTILPPIDVMPATHGNIYDFVTINLGRTGATMEIPEYTVRQLDDHRSPQSKAYLWLAFSSSYPADVLQDMPLWRTQQLFALATLFFSLSNNNNQQEQWLNASLSECQWSTDLVCYPALPHNQGLLVNTELDQVIRDIRLDGWHHNNNNNNNSSTSVLPAELELLKGLQHLQVTNTVTTGSLLLDDFLPTVQLANLPRLHTLVLHNNHLTGGIPSELGALTGLRQLELDRNELSGRVPDEICALTTQNEQELFLVVDCTGTTSAQLICPENDCNCNCS